MPTVARSHSPSIDVSYFTGATPVHPVIASIAHSEEPPRALITGTAGSGKSTALRNAQSIFDDLAISYTVFTAYTDLAKVPAAHVLLVDDLHLLDEGTVEAVQRRAQDPRAALLVTTRSWPRSELSTGIARQLERSQPAIVLGQVSRSDVLDYIGAQEQSVPPACLEHIIEVTGGVAWLVSVALSAHDPRDCADDPGHHALGSALEQSIAHRMDALDDDLRHAIEALSFDAYDSAVEDDPTSPALDDLIIAGYAEGLLLRSGGTVPAVRSAVRASTPTRRLVNYITGAATSGADASESGDLLARIHDTRLGLTIAKNADRVLDADPRHAEDLYRTAIEVGADPGELAPRRARAAWARGDLDAAAFFVDAAMGVEPTDPDSSLADTGAATWAGRGMLAMGCGFYRALPPKTPESRARAVIAQVGAGIPPEGEEGASTRVHGHTAPTTVRVAMDLLQRGLRSSLRTDGADEALADLVRASHLYTSSQTAAPIPELPAVIAAIVAINLGELGTARSVIDAAVDGGQGGAWAHPRLLLWRAWVAMLRVRPTEAREALAAALQACPKPGPRDDLMVHALRVAISRRWEDTAALASMWEGARESLQRVDVDLYNILPLSEFVSAAARLGDDAVTDPHAARAFTIIESLGAAPLWSTQIRWSGIQHGILINRPNTVNAHARALVEAAATSRVAGVMAKAGRAWTAMLAGSVDVDAVDTAAQELASIGLAWDAARLAGQGASLTADRKSSARLLSRARELHPQDSARAVEHSSEDETTNGHVEGAALSDREIDVARLVVQGKTYAEIGETIFISPRTAEHHIASIRRRLGATSRSDLIAKLRVALQPSGAPAHGMSGR